MATFDSPDRQLLEEIHGGIGALLERTAPDAAIGLPLHLQGTIWRYGVDGFSGLTVELDFRAGAWLELKLGARQHVVWRRPLTVVWL